MINLVNEKNFWEFVAEQNTYVQHQPNTVGKMNRFAQYDEEATIGELSKLGFPRLEMRSTAVGSLQGDLALHTTDYLTRTIRIINKYTPGNFDQKKTVQQDCKAALLQILNYIKTAQEDGGSCATFLRYFDVNSVTYEEIDYATADASATGIMMRLQLRQSIKWEEVTYAPFPDYPKPPKGSIYVSDGNTVTYIAPGEDGQVLVTKGEGLMPEWQASSPSGGAVIEVTKLEFLALVNSNGLTYPAIYKITDIDNGLFIETLSGSTFATSGTLFSLQPSYIVSGIYKGQLLPTDSVSIGDIWVYGNHFWESITGVNSTPIDFLNLDLTDWIKVPKSEANGYINIEFIAQVGIYNGDLYLTKLQNSATRDEIDISSYFDSQLDDALIKSWVVIGENSDFFSSSNNGSIVNNRFNDVLFAYNTTPNNFPNTPFIYNVDGTLGELAGNVNYANSSIHDGVLNGADCLIARNSMTNSEIKNFNLAGNGAIRISNLNNSIIDNVVITQLSGKLGLSDLYLCESTILNVTDINITQSSFHDIIIDFTGFNVDVYGVNIINGKGWFVVTHDFATNPLNSGDTLLYNIIPKGARITNLVISGATNGNSIQLGLSGDDESLLILPTSLLNNQLITVSNAATQNRSLLIKALTDPITTGDITIKCEFVC